MKAAPEGLGIRVLASGLHQILRRAAVALRISAWLCALHTARDVGWQLWELQQLLWHVLAPVQHQGLRAGWDACDSSSLRPGGEEWSSHLFGAPRSMGQGSIMRLSILQCQTISSPRRLGLLKFRHKEPIQGFVIKSRYRFGCNQGGDASRA